MSDAQRTTTTGDGQPAQARQGDEGARGFTLIELMIALALALAVTAAALGVMLTAIDMQKEGTMRAELARDAQFVMDIVSRDLANAGVGVPRGFESNANGNLLQTGASTYNSLATGGSGLNNGADDQLRPAIRVGLEDYVAFIGDLPYPNAELNGIGGIAIMGAANEVGVVSELSPCTPPEAGGSGYTCVTPDESYVQDVGALACDTSTIGSPTCPWGMKKWQEHGAGNPTQLIFGAVDGSWFRREFNPLTGGFVAGPNGRGVIQITGGNLPLNRFVETNVGGGYVSQLDRVIYAVSETATPANRCTGGTPPCTIWRRQCWGWDISADNPNDSTFPSVGIAAGSEVRANDASFPATCDAPDNGTAWEPIMGDIESLSFRYYSVSDLGTNLGDLSRQTAAATRVVEIDLYMKRDIPGSGGARSLEQRLKKRVWMENTGGLVTYPNNTDPTVGGCNNDVNHPNECNPQ